MQYFLFFYRLHHIELTQVGWKMLTFRWMWLIFFLSFALWLLCCDFSPSVCRLSYELFWADQRWWTAAFLVCKNMLKRTECPKSKKTQSELPGLLFPICRYSKSLFLFSLWIPLMDFQPKCWSEFKAAENWRHICTIWAQISALTARKCLWLMGGSLYF